VHVRNEVHILYIPTPLRIMLAQ